MKKMNIFYNSKHFLNVLLLLLTLVGVNTNVWGADCIYVINGSNYSDKRKNFDVTFCTVSNENPNKAINISFTIELESTFLGKSLTCDVYAHPSDGSGSIKIKSGLKVSNGGTENPSISFTTTKDITSYSLDQTSGDFGGKRTLNISNIKVTYQYAASLSASNITMDNTPVGGYTEKTITVNYQNSTNSVTLSATEQSDANNFFTITPASHSISDDCNGSAEFTVRFAPTSAVTNATATYRFSGNGASTDVTVTGTSFAVVDPTFTSEMESSYPVGHADIDLRSLWTSNNTTGVITYSIVSFGEGGVNNDGGVEPTIRDNRWLSLGKAGTVVVKMHQDASTGYNEKYESYTITIYKYTPKFKWDGDEETNYTFNYYYNTTKENIFSTSNNDFGYTIVSDNEPAANVIDNTLHVYNVEEIANITVTQEENYKWNGKTKTYTVTPVELNNHVPFTITSSNYIVPFKYGSEGSFSWEDGGIKLGDGGGGLNWDDKYYDIVFSGIPDKLSFDYEKQASGATGVEWWVKESSDGSNWIDSKWGKQTSGSGSATNIQLLPTTRYLRLCYSGNFGGYFKNIHVTELNDFSATPALVDFGTKGINFGTQEETVTFNHANAGRVTTMEIVGDDADYFSIERNTIAGTGRDLYATANIVVSFDNKKGPAGHEPSYSAVLRIEDNAKPKHFLNIPLQGVRDGKTEPEFSFNANHLPYFVGTNIANVASSTNTDYTNCPLDITTSDASIAEVIDGTLHIYNKKEEVTITISQGENKDFSAGSATFTFTPRERPERTVPMQLVKSIYNEGTVEAGNKCAWDDAEGGVRVGNTNVVVDDWIWYNSEKNFTIAFDGTPGRLSFEYKNTAWLVTPDADHYTYEVQESSDGGTWHTIWYTDATTTEWTAVKEVTLNPSTRYLRFSFSGNYWGFYRNINISELVGYKYLRAESDGRYLSRGSLWGTQAIVDDFGMACRISNYTNDNTNFYTRFLFVDNQQYLYEADNHEMYTDDGTANNQYNLWKQNVTDGTILTFQSGNEYPGDSRKGQYVTLNGDALALTADAAAATKWKMEDYTEHEAHITAMLDREAAEAAARDFGASVNTLAKVRTEILENDFETTVIDVPELTLGEQAGEYRNGAAGTKDVYDNTISGLVPGFYRLTVQAFSRISSADIAWTCHAAGMESVLAYIYANDVAYPIRSLYHSYQVNPLEPSDEQRGGHYYSNDLTSAGKAFSDSKRYLNDVYIYVEADPGSTTGTLRYGIKNPSYVPGAWLAYKNITLTRIARKEYIFEGTIESEKEDWKTDGNWNRKEVPNEHHAVIIRSDVVIEDEVVAYSLAIENDAKVEVAPTGGLTIGAGGVKGATAENFKLAAGTTGATKGKTGYLRISPEYTGAMPEATVELYSKAYYDYNDKAENIAKWQYVGAPIDGTDVMAKTVYKKSWIYSWNESSEEWTNQRSTLKFTPFVGYATTQRTSPEGMLLTYVGQLVSNQGTNVVDLAYSGKGKGHNVLANSFSAPIDITKFTDDDFVNAEKAVYIFNTGSRRDAAAAEETKSTDAPGQYLSIPIGSAREMKGAFGLPTVIPSMQGFCVHATGTEAQIRLNYEKLVWNGNYDENPNAPARIPSHANVNTEKQVGALQVTLLANGWSDHLYMLESENFDALYENGYDALKIMGDELNIFSIEGDDQLSVDATDNIVGTHLGVRTGDETAYTFVFSHLQTEDGLALYDAETDQTIDINEGTEYTFFAEPNVMVNARFQIIERANTPAITTGMENAESEVKLHKFIKDNQLFVLKNGVLYNAAGVRVR